MGSRACFSFLAPDQGVSAGMCSSLRASCWPELRCLPVICGLSQPRGSGCRIRLCFIPRPCFWALVDVEAALRGTAAPRKASSSSGWELPVTRRAPEGPSQDARLQVICAAFHVTTVPAAPTSKVAFITSHGQRLHVEGWAGRKAVGGSSRRRRHCAAGAASGALGRVERPLESRPVTCQQETRRRPLSARTTGLPSEAPAQSSPLLSRTHMPGPSFPFLPPWLVRG